MSSVYNARISPIDISNNFSFVRAYIHEVYINIYTYDAKHALIYLRSIFSKLDIINVYIISRHADAGKLKNHLRALNRFSICILYRTSSALSGIAASLSVGIISSAIFVVAFFFAAFFHGSSPARKLYRKASLRACWHIFFFFLLLLYICITARARGLSLVLYSSTARTSTFPADFFFFFFFAVSLPGCYLRL